MSEQLVNVGSFSFGPQGMTVAGRPNIEEWGVAGQALSTLHRGIQLCIGDWLRFGEDRYGEEAAQFIDSADWAEQTVRVYRWLSGAVPPEHRKQGLGVAHYMAAATLPPPTQRDVLSRASEERWTVKRTKEEVAVHNPPSTEETLWVAVKADDGDHQDALVSRFETEGLKCHPYSKVAKKGSASPNSGGA